MNIFPPPSSHACFCSDGGLSFSLRRFIQNGEQGIEGFIGFSEEKSSLPLLSVQSYHSEVNMKLRVRAFGMAVGLVSGGGLFVATILDVVREKGITLTSLQSFFLGYDISYVGACVGLIWGFVYGFIFGHCLRGCTMYSIRFFTNQRGLEYKWFAPRRRFFMKINHKPRIYHRGFIIFA